MAKLPFAKLEVLSKETIDTFAEQKKQIGTLKKMTALARELGEDTKDMDDLIDITDRLLTDALKRFAPAKIIP